LHVLPFHVLYVLHYSILSTRVNPNLDTISKNSKVFLVHNHSTVPFPPSGAVVERHCAVAFHPNWVYKATATPGPDELYKNIKQGEGQRLYVWAPVKGFEPTTSEEALVTG
jgi:hypothetical protein